MKVLSKIRLRIVLGLASKLGIDVTRLFTSKDFDIYIKDKLDKTSDKKLEEALSDSTDEAKMEKLLGDLSGMIPKDLSQDIISRVVEAAKGEKFLREHRRKNE